MERVKLCEIAGEFTTPPVPDALLIECLSNIVRRHLYPYLPATVPITYDEYISKYNGKKLARYLRAKQDLYFNPWLTRRDRRISAFAKKEMLLIKENKPFEKMIPRVVQAGTPKFNLVFGVFVRPIEERIYHAIDSMYNEVTGSPDHVRTVMKGLNAMEQGAQIAYKWNKFKRPVFVPLDAKRFDQCVNVPLLKVQHDAMTKCYPNRKHKKQLRFCLDATLKRECVGKAMDGIVKYKLEGGLCSGETTTALTGVFVMCVSIFAYLVYELKFANFEVIDGGDDAGIILEADQLYRLENLNEYFLALGLRMTIGKPVTVMEEIEFCSTQPVFDGQHWRMVRDPRVSVTKDATSLKPLGSQTELANYLNSVGKGGLSLTGGIPLLQEYYSSMIRNATTLIGRKKFKDIKLEGGLYYLSRRMTERYSPVSVEARVSFYKAFGILPDLQIEMEQEYRNKTIKWCSRECTVRQEYNIFETK